MPFQSGGQGQGNKNTVETSPGTQTVSSPQGCGSTNKKSVSIMCPANHLASFVAAALLAEECPRQDCSNARFLVVDDIASMRRVIGSLLKEQLRHIRISEAPDGYIVKPFNASTLRAKLEQIMTRREKYNQAGFAQHKCV